MQTYLTKHKRKGYGKFTWTLTPPDDIIEAGLVTKKSYHDGRTARQAERYLKKIIEDYRSGKLAGDVLPEDPTFRVLMGHYLKTSHFNSLSLSTRNNYSLSLEQIASTPFGKKFVGYMKLSEFTSKVCSTIYDHWVTNHGIPWANQKKILWGVLFSHALSLDLVQRNPMASVRAAKHTPNTLTWTPDQVERFLDVAFNDFKYRPVGLLVMLCYEYAQRPVDIANLKWDNCCFDTETIIIQQRKRGATVNLPMSSTIREMLLQQKKDFDFQEYVLPYLRADNAWRPMPQTVWNALTKEVKELAGIPPELQIRGLRTTAINQMVEAGVDSTGIMPVTGHKRLQSLSPYMKHTRAAAKRALDTRRQG